MAETKNQVVTPSNYPLKKAYFSQSPLLAAEGDDHDKLKFIQNCFLCKPPD